MVSKNTKIMSIAITAAVIVFVSVILWIIGLGSIVGIGLLFTVQILLTAVLIYASFKFMTKKSIGFMTSLAVAFGVFLLQLLIAFIFTFIGIVFGLSVPIP